MDSSSTSSDSLLKFLAWLETNKKQVILIGGGAVALAILVAAIFYYQSQKETRASEALSNVRKPFSAAAQPSAEVTQAYLKVAHDYEGTKAAGRALVEAATQMYLEGKYSDSEASFKRFLNEYPESPFQPQGMLGLASALDAQGKNTEAIDQYEKIRKRYPSDSVADETKLALARLYEKEKPADSYRLYNELVATGSQSGVGSEAGIRMADLMEKYPDLARTNGPSAPTPPSVASMSPPRQPATNTRVMTITNSTTLKPGRTNFGAGSTNAPTAATAPFLLQPKPLTNKP
jgi:TolA-binding protein